MPPTGTPTLTSWHVPDDGIIRNPYGYLLRRALEAHGVRVVSVPHEHWFGRRALWHVPDAIHFQFIDVFLLPAGPAPALWRAILKAPVFLLQVLLLRLAGCRIVWTVHNLATHERRLAAFERLGSLVFARLAHALVVHGEAAREAVVRACRVAPERVTVVFHPNYDGAYPDVTTREDARRQLGIRPDACVFLSLGPIRAYKGLVDAVRALGELADPDIEYLIAGDARDRDVLADLQRAATADQRVHVTAGHVPPDGVDRLLKACDVVALPYRDILTSGAAVLAMTYGRPCIAPRLGCIPEVLTEDDNFLYDPAEPDGLRSAMARAWAARAHLPAMGQANRARASAWTWNRAADLLLALYRGEPGTSLPPAMSGEAP